MTTQPVISTQPQQVVIVQPQRGHWQTGLFDCFSDMGVCLCGMFCTICLGCDIAAHMDECCLCGPATAMRAVYRTKYGIPVYWCDYKWTHYDISTPFFPQWNDKVPQDKIYNYKIVPKIFQKKEK